MKDSRATRKSGKEIHDVDGAWWRAAWWHQWCASGESGEKRAISYAVFTILEVSVDNAPERRGTLCCMWYH